MSFSFKDKLEKNRIDILIPSSAFRLSLILTAITTIVLGVIQLSTLWVTIPFWIIIYPSYKKDFSPEFDITDFEEYYGLIFIFFFIVLVVYSFLINSVFGWVFLLLCIILLTLLFLDCLEDYSFINYFVVFSSLVVLFNIGLGLWCEWLLLSYSAPASLIAIFVLLIRSDGYYNRMFDFITETDDMKQLKKASKSLLPKIKSLNDFNTQLNDAIISYERKAIRIIDSTYGLYIKGINKNAYYKSYATIQKKYSSSVDTVVSLSCDNTVKKIRDLITQKQQIIASNNSDIRKYYELLHLLEKRYKEEYALKHMKLVNKDTNTQLDDISDLTQSSVNSYKFEDIIGQIDNLDAQVKERRKYEAEIGSIEI